MVSLSFWEVAMIRGCLAEYFHSMNCRIQWPDKIMPRNHLVISTDNNAQNITHSLADVHSSPVSFLHWGQHWQDAVYVPLPPQSTSGHCTKKQYLYNMNRIRWKAKSDIYQTFLGPLIFCLLQHNKEGKIIWYCDMWSLTMEMMVRQM